MGNYSVAKHLGVGIFILIAVQWVLCKNNNCDIDLCKSLFSTVFKDFFRRGTRRLCRSSTDSLECVDKCFQTFFPEFDLINSETPIASAVCNEDIEYVLNKHWNCISGHFHRLLTCFAMSGSMTPTNISSKTLKLLSCRKLLDVLNCPYDILHDCEDEAIDVVNSLLIKVFKAPRESNCKMPSHLAFDLAVSYSLNNSYLTTAACLDSSPNVADNCLFHYVQNYEANKTRHCRNVCEKIDGQKCVLSPIMSDFYVPVLSFGKYSCKEDSAIEDEVQMQEPSKYSTVPYISEIPSEVPSKYATSTTNTIGLKDDFFLSEEAKTSGVLSSDYNSFEASTLNNKLDGKEINHDEILSTANSPRNFPLHVSVAPSKVYQEISSFSSGFETENKTVINGASMLESCLLPLVVNFAVQSRLYFSLYISGR